ncbi:PiggyBac transposable element-derived protein 4 [Anthophora retusa]
MASHSNSVSSDDSDVPLAEILTKRPRIARGNLSEYSSDSSDEIIPFHRLFARSTRILSSSEDENTEPSINNMTTSHIDWADPIGNQPRLTPFVGTPGFKTCNQTYEKPEDIYFLFMSDEFFDLVVTETNRYAQQCLSKQTSYRLDEWIATDKNEIKRFFGLIMWMGIVKLPEISLYWSKDPAYSQNLPPSIMSRNRFELLLRMLHFNDNDKENVNDRLYKIKPVIDMLNENFQKYFEPGEIVCVDESLIPFRGRIVFRQYIKQKRHKYGIKLFKLCSGSGYTLAFKIYCGKKIDREKTTPTNVVLSLCKNIFGKGHTICTDNWYTSIELAKKLVAQNTHLVGTIRSNRRGIPKDLLSKKLMRYEYIAKESNDGLTILKWKDKRDVLLLSTKHSNETVTMQKRGNIVTKPKVIVDYNEGKSSVDISDQMASYCSPLRKSVKWYKKIVFELCLNTAVVNSWVIYNSLTNRKITSVEFRKTLAMNLMSCNNNNNSPRIEQRRKRHEIKKKEGHFNSIRRRCKICYERNVKKFGSKSARNCTIKVGTFCDSCVDKPHLCMACFNKVHRNIPL